jgi:2'-5' RNA ligase
MANRRRLGVALLLDPPVATEVDGLRRAVGDPALGRIPPHVTLVPPVNVRHDDLPAALAVLRRAAAAVPGPLRLAVGRPSTFLPVNPVLYLAVGGELEGLAALRNSVFQAPLQRSLSWPWVPHVTLADGAAEERIEAALTALADYSAVVDIDRVVLLEESPGRVWSPLADAALGPTARIGTGGLMVELVAGRIIDPRVTGEGEGAGGAPVVTAYRDGEPVGWARTAPDGRAEVHVLDSHRGDGIEDHLGARIDWLRAERGYSNATEA